MTLDYWDYHLATGCPVSRAKKLLSEMRPALRERVLLAIKQQSDGRFLVDPVESDPMVAAKVRDAKAEAERAADLSGHVGRGSGHFVWAIQAQILAERHGIAWFSPGEMNPDLIFD